MGNTQKNPTPTIRARIDRLMDGKGSTKAYASVTIADAFAVHDIRITEKDEKISVRMPFRSYKSGSETKYVDTFHAITTDARANMVAAVTEAYEQALEERMANLEHDGAAMSQQMLSTVEVGSFGLPGSVVLNKDDAIGKVASENMYVGEYLTNSRLITEEEYQKLVAEQTKGLDKGYCLVTLKFPSSSAGVASVLRAGHIVDVHECIENEDYSITVKKVLSSMYVYDVLNKDLQSLAELDIKLEEAVAEDDTDYDFQPAFVVFRCTEAQAQTLIRLERMESLHLTLQRTGG